MCFFLFILNLSIWLQILPSIVVNWNQCWLSKIQRCMTHLPLGDHTVKSPMAVQLRMRHLEEAIFRRSLLTNDCNVNDWWLNIGVFLETLHICRHLCAQEAWQQKKPGYSTLQCVIGNCLFSLTQFPTYLSLSTNGLLQLTLITIRNIFTDLHGVVVSFKHHSE